jgi:hypothetical protein
VNGSKKWVIIGGLCSIAAIVLAAFSGYMAAAKSDAAFRDHAERFMTDSEHFGTDISALQTQASVSRQREDDSDRRDAEFHEAIKSIDERMERLNDKIDLLIQAGMREGKINR